jgi:hypothetical protein
MTDKPRTQVAICIPSGRQWEADMAIRLSAAASRAAAQGIPTITINEKSSIIAMSRNSMANNAINNSATHVFWCDSDNIPPVDVISRLLAHDKDIVGGIYCKRVPPYELLGVPLAPVNISKGGVVPFWLMPGGCMMIKARVYRTIPKPWYFDTVRREGSPMEAFIHLLEDHYHLPVPKDIAASFLTYTALNRWLEEEEQENKTKFHGGSYMGEDYNFCLKAQRYGFQVWCDLDLSMELGHLGETTVYLSKPEIDKEKAGNI